MSRGQALIFALCLLTTAGCDHATKRIAQAALEGSPPISLVADTVRFELVANPGAFLSLGARLPEQVRGPLFILLVPTLLVVVCVLLLRSGAVQRHQIVGLGLLAGGGMGNWVDRLMHDGNVTDFVSLGLGPLRTGIFNLADIAVIVGVILVLWQRRAPPSTAKE